MLKKGILIITSLLLAASSLFAHGKGDIDEREVAQMDSWQEDFDIDKKKDGKYNVLVTVEDKGGNQTVGGPYNIFIDKDSDYTISGITNPIKNMRVPGNLNIVGTCIDDDGVDKVWLILDGAEPVLANGKEFWSYTLDTTKLTEGPHTIEVYGEDINGLSSKGKASKVAKVTWNLDRNLPVTTVTNHQLGELVSGKINLKGTVSDGNGIKKLSYSLDGRQNFYDLKLDLDKKTGICSFELPVNTKDFPDGAQICWFKAIDNMGSIGYNSFLYFVDNTKPDVKIVTPAQDEVKNGFIQIAGYAKDAIGIQSLKWSCNNGQSGEFELIPGNPYWCTPLIDTTSSSKNIEFTVVAKDIAGNEVPAKRVIPLNQEADKPVVVIETPAAGGTVEGAAGSVFLRGIASDDDEVAKVEYSLDGGKAQTIETQGVFCALLNQDTELKAGKHTVTVCAIDKYGVKGNAVTADFTSKGNIPVFTEAKINSSTGSEAAFTGIKVHPEANPVFATSVSSESGISLVSYKLEWGKEGVKTGDIPVKAGDKTVAVNVPLSGADVAYGTVKITVTAADIYNRIVEQRETVKLLNLTDVTVDMPRVVFDDSRISEAGDIINDPEHPVTGYFAGGKIKSATLVPATPFAKLTFTENTITLTATDSLGASVPVKVRVVSEDNIPYESQSLVFHSDSPAPTIIVNENEAVLSVEPVEGEAAESVKVTGKYSSETPLTSLGYRIFSAGIKYDTKNTKVKHLISEVDSTMKAGEFTALPVKGNEFAFEIPADQFRTGVSVVEVVANNGKTAAGSVKVWKLPAVEAGGQKITIKPLCTWADGVDVYSIVIRQKKSNSEAVSGFGKTYYRADLPAGNSNLSELEKGKPFSTYTASKEGNAKVFITEVGGTEYASGMHVALPKSASSVKAKVTVLSDFALNGISWTIEGEKVPGGDEKQNGKVDMKSGVRSPAAGVYEAEIPLNNLPCRLTTIKVTAETAGGNASYKGTIAVVREKDAALVNDAKVIHWASSAECTYDKDNGRYVLGTNKKFGAYANVYSPVTVTLAPPQAGLTATADGNYVYILAEKEGLYKNVAVKVTDPQGLSYTSSPVTLLVDDSAPAVEITAPETGKWVKKNTSISVKASDVNGISSVEYSIDKGESWNTAVAQGGGVFTAVLKMEGIEDGLVPVDVRVKDAANKYSYTQTVIHKDTTKPVVNVILPCEGDVVNGENLVVFTVSDNGRFKKAEYVPPKTGKETPVPVEFEIGNPLVTTHFGTKDKPINEIMGFNFYDENDNVETVHNWGFVIDSKSDLPVAEVHLPEEDSVQTTTFKVSGVCVDDDGPTRVYYKLDDGQFQLVSEEFDSSFEIEIKLDQDEAVSQLKDNEHKITVYAEDLNGVKGPEFVRNFKVSLQEPKGAVVTPPIEETVKGWVKLTGNATDKNGISKVYISVDNGNTYNEAKGNFSHTNERSDWTYEFDSRVVQDGTHVVFLKVVDWYGIEGLYSSLINIDNTPPSINLELPLDDSKTTKMLFFSGQTTDNIGLEKLYITVRSLEGKIVSEKLSKIELVPGAIISQSIDLSSLDSGFYNVELTGEDAANNITRVSRNVQLDKKAVLSKVDLLYPLNGEFVQGHFNIYGTAISEVNVEKLELFVDGESVAETKLSASGYFKFDINPEAKTGAINLENGQHQIRVKAHLANVTTIDSNTQYINYNSAGPWVTIDNFTYGDFAIERPYVAGRAGCVISDEEKAAVSQKGASKEAKAELAAKTIEKVELSLNNGKSFETVSNGETWRYRIENEDIAEGYHFLLLRATLKNGETAITRVIVQVDKTKPTVKLISPGEGGRFNQNIEFSGLAHDNQELKNVKLFLRKGDKASYEVPAFIQGLYIDAQFWGATLYSVGAGLSFFDDNVRLQAQFGQFTQEQRNIFSATNSRYGGNVVGGKILANVAYIPFMYFFGRDYEWLSANVTVGANFSRFSQTGSGKPQILSAVLAQLEFPRVTFQKQKMFRTIAVYTEGQLWFIPTDVSSDEEIKNLVPQISIGLRVNVF